MLRTVREDVPDTSRFDVLLAKSVNYYISLACLQKHASGMYGIFIKIKLTKPAETQIEKIVFNFYNINPAIDDSGN